MATPNKTPEIKETFTLPSGKVADRLALSSRNYFEYRRLMTTDIQSKQGGDNATKGLLLKAYLIDGQPLTIDILEDQMSFEDALTLTSRLDDLFVAAQALKT